MSIILSPTANQVLSGPKQGQPLKCSGEWVDMEDIIDSHGKHTHIIDPHSNETISVTLSQPSVSDQSRTTVTDNYGKWSADFSSCRPGSATLVFRDSAGTALDHVTFSIAPNSRQPITVTLDNMQDPGPDHIGPAAGAHIKVYTGGATVTISATIGSPTHHVEFQSSLDNYLTTKQLSASGGGLWTGQLSLAENQAPGRPVLLVRDVDFFGDPRETTYDLWLDDVTPPKIEILEPAEDQELYLVAGQPKLNVTVRGTVNDGQSRYKAGTLAYTFDGSTIHIEPDTSGNFTFALSADPGPNRVDMTAEDMSGNKTPDLTPVTREFIVASKYKPKTIDELLSSRSYLADLIRFADSHVLDGNNHDMSSALLSATFMPVAGAGVSDYYGTLADPGSAVGERPVNELLPAVYLLRTRPRGLLVNFAFESEQGQETPDSGPSRLHAALSKPGMIGTPGTPTAGALEVDANVYASGGGAVAGLLNGLGKDNADFSVSFWIYMNSGAAGTWRGVIYKGHEGPAFSLADSNRTFGVWLHPNSNQIHYRIGTVNNPNEGGDSLKEIRLNQWTHVCYVKRGSSLELYLDGDKDSSVGLSGDVVANSDALYMGKSPHYAGFHGALDEVRIYDFALSGDDIYRLSRDRSPSVVQEAPLRAYVRSAYEALLVAHGTSYEELRALPAKGTAGRRAIAERLGLTAPNATDDGLDALLLPSLTDRQNEDWLGGTFDLPTTAELLPPTASTGWRGWLLGARQDYLARRWQAEDADILSTPRPMLDPDLIERNDLNPSHAPAIAALGQRQAQLDGQWAKLRSATNVGTKLALVYSPGEVNSLATIEDKGLTGAPIGDLLPPLGLTMSGFRRVRFYQLLQQPLSEREEDDLAHLLTQAWKLRACYTNWVVEERVLSSPLWPNSLNAGAFVTGNFKRDFPPWRGNVADRSKFENMVSARMSAFEALAGAHERAVLDAQRTALPLFRDRLLAISDLPSAADVMDAITERLLVDVASTGAATVTLIDQAALMLQSLINGIRLGRFEGGHPAAAWKLRTTWLDDPKNDLNLGYFDEEWTWMGSYSSWRSAKRTYLYPEIALFPDLRTKDTKPYQMTDAFKTSFLKELRKLTPSVPDDSWMTNNTAGIANYEMTFFAPVAVGVMLERSGLCSLALDWYRKVYETRNPPGARAKAQLLIDENGKNKPPYILYDDRWTLEIDPHTNCKKTDIIGGQVQSRFGNPYTRFILARITRCLAALADAEFARGTGESRIKALDLYLEAKQILGFPELDDLPPTSASEGYLPNPEFGALRDHVAASLRKLRRGLTYVGTPALPDTTRGADGVSTILRPTLYRFRVLVERAKQLLAQTQNLEAQYLAALEKRDSEEEKYRREAAGAQLADETVNLRALQQTEAKGGIDLANAQKRRAQIQADRYADWIAAGPNQNERAQVTAISEAATARQVANIADTVLAAAQAVQTTNSIWDILGSVGSKPAIAAAMGTAVAARGIAQGFVIDRDTTATLQGIAAAQERRQEEWALGRDLANQDVLISQEQIDLATDRQAIADKEYSIATIQRDQAQDMLKFLNTKFTSVEFYDWMIGVLAEVYAFLLRTATTVAHQAEGQLAFERQQSPAGLIKQDYWNYVSQQGSNSSTPDRRGITASAQLLEDLTAVDQYAFDSEKRLLNLSQSFSLAGLFPIEFEEFRSTGLLSFATTMRMFDEGFPGHYMRLMKKVRMSLAALIPPNQGIRATLSTSGLSRVVTGDASYPVMVIRQEPQSVALSSPMASTGVFELDIQSDLLYPFEGMGVDTNWYLELPPAGNPFDYDTVFDVLISIEYTALNSIDLRDRVVKQLPREAMSDRAFSVRRDLADTWYELANNSASPGSISLTLSRSDFPPQLQQISIREVAMTVRRQDGRLCDFKVKPSVRLSASQYFEASEAGSVNGIVSSRQSGATTWHSDLLGPAGIVEQQGGTWNFALADADGQADSVLQLLRDGEVDDILVVFTFVGMKPAWPT